MYNQALKVIKENRHVKNILGENLLVMNCEGKSWPLIKNQKFHIVLYGDKQNGKIQV